MKSDQKIEILRSKIDESVLPLIKSDYVLYSLPYYTNIGDTLIWEGTRRMLRRCKYKCVGVCGWNDYPQAKPAPGTTILILGGGFFGDVWRQGWQNVLDGIKGCEDHDIVVLPQSIFYEDETVRGQDAEFLARFKNLTICVRDNQSLDMARKYFSNPSILVPDMAFHMDYKKLRKKMAKSTGKTLYLKRNDKEFAGIDPEFAPGEQVDVSDWPTMSGELPWVGKFFERERKLRNIKNKAGRQRDYSVKLMNWFYEWSFRPQMIDCAVKFLSSYDRIVTTRLHVMILALLLGCPVSFLDNSYGKNSSLYQTWLSDCDRADIHPER